MLKSVKLFLSYVLPSMMGMLIVGSFSIIDTIFIGNSAGKIGLASVAVTWPVVMLFGAIGDMIGTGAAILISQYRGEGHLEKARRIFEQMLLLELIGGIILIIPLYTYLKEILSFIGATDELMPLAYKYARIIVLCGIPWMFSMAFTSVIRNDNRPVFAMGLTVIGLLLNIGLDYLFIFPLKGGVVGAAYATVVSQVIMDIIGIAYFCSSYTPLKLSVSSFKIISFSEIKHILKSGIPTFGNQSSILAMLFLHNWQSLHYGGVNGLAAYTFIGTIESMGSLLLTGLSLGVQPLVAFLFGARKFVRQNLMGNWGYWTAFGLGTAMMIISFAGYQVFPAWFNLYGEVAELAGHGLIISSTAFVLLGVIRVAGYYYQSTGKIRDAALLIYGDAFFALPLCLFVLPLWFGLDGVWLAMPISRILLFIMVLYLWYYPKHRQQN